jgi:hypothetical protein
MTTPDLTAGRLAELERLARAARTRSSRSTPWAWSPTASPPCAPGCGELEAERGELRAALAPFAAVARGLPPGWPAACPLTWEAFGNGIRLTYFAVGADTAAPTIAAYRRAAALPAPEARP